MGIAWTICFLRDKAFRDKQEKLSSDEKGRYLQASNLTSPSWLLWARCWWFPCSIMLLALFLSSLDLTDLASSLDKHVFSGFPLGWPAILFMLPVLMPIWFCYHIFNFSIFVCIMDGQDSFRGQDLVYQTLNVCAVDCTRGRKEGRLWLNPTQALILCRQYLIVVASQSYIVTIWSSCVSARLIGAHNGERYA